MINSKEHSVFVVPVDCSTGHPIATNKGRLFFDRDGFKIDVARSNSVHEIDGSQYFSYSVCKRLRKGPNQSTTLSGFIMNDGKFQDLSFKLPDLSYEIKIQFHRIDTSKKPIYIVTKGYSLLSFLLPHNQQQTL